MNERTYGVKWWIAVPALLAATACGASEASKASDSAPSAPAAAAAFDSRAASPAVIAQGKGIYDANCIACHGETGKGDGPAAGVLKPPPRDHTDRAYMSTLSDEDLKKVIVMGGAIKGRPLMPSHPQIRGEQLDALVAYVRSLSEGQ